MSDWKKFILFIVVVLGIGWFTASKTFLINQNPEVQEKPQPNPLTPQQRLTVGTTELLVEVRQTEAEQALGLSWRKNLGENAGMLFAYPSQRKVLFWMKGMQFPLDFILIANDIVVEVIENVSHPTSENPVVRTIVPTAQVDAVLEVNAGYVATHGIRVGDKVAFVK